MNKDFRSYLLQHERTHYYRVKTVVPIGDFGSNEEDRARSNSFLSRIENALLRYDPVAIERVKKTILQRCPLDFVNVHNKEVYIMDLELGMPVSPVELQHIITVILNAPESHVMVYGESDPREIEDQITMAVKEINDEAKELGLEPASVLTDKESSEMDDVEAVKYGDAYNSRLLAYFNAQRNHDGETDESFNDDVKDAVSAHPKVEPGEEVEIRTVRRTYRDEKGNLRTLTRKLDRFGKSENYD